MTPICDCCRRPAEELHKDYRAMAPPLSPGEGALADQLLSEEDSYTEGNVRYHADGTPFSEAERRLCFQAQLEGTAECVLLCSSCYDLDGPGYWETKATASAKEEDTGG